ncbi:MAG: TetR/AcrR family transcriptional regulator [Armatimonadetes bacterium]|nr:TetR/AcrR family transcriptional regulator [Armatimonadota bacterium]
MQGRRRLRSPERKAQIVQVALDVVAERGVQGSTLARIAARAGITPAALYAHFANKREIMVAALDLIFQRIDALNHSSHNPNALERLREIGLQHTTLLTSQQDGFVFPLFEFMAAPPEEGLREELRTRQLAQVEVLADIVREGQEQGTIAPEIDPYQFPWWLTSKAWTEDVAQLMGVSDHWNEDRSLQLLDLMLQVIAAGGSSAAGTADGS